MLRPYPLPLVASLTLVVLLLPVCSDSAGDVAATVAPPETATTMASAASTTLSENAAIATMETLQEAFNACDSDAAMALIADGGVWNSAPPDSPVWEKQFAERGAWGRQGNLSDCRTTDGRLTCLETWEEKLLGGKAGVIRVWEWEIHVDDQGLIANAYYEDVSGQDDDGAFIKALGAWMATAYPESYETFYMQGNFAIREVWVSGIAELSPLIDEFVAQSDEYPLS